MTDITKDPENSEDFTRVSTGVSAQIFYLSKKSSQYQTLIKRAAQSYKEENPFDIGIENTTNIIKQINPIE